MKTVYKYVLDPGLQYLPLLTGSTILSAVKQGDQVVLYALVNTATKGSEMWAVYAKGTGHSFLKECQGENFIGTVLLAEDLVFHVFAWKNDHAPE